MTVPSGSARPGVTALERLEVGVSALVRWSESRHIRREIAQSSGCELAPSELRLLEFFGLVEPLRISVIAECMQVDVSTVSLQLRRLRENHLVQTIPVLGDRRASLIAITPQGRATVERVRAARHVLLRAVFADVPDDRLDQAADVLLRIHEHMLAGLAEQLGLGATDEAAPR
ncbi:MarR family transcriptional regulator [Frankia sp. AiPa1]|uniref:MarR family winged helix-turn-helix transcriptional regulator n=1 Tax=Frankia sp. AiPa1 TaxID=573492 RepID=UPI00202AEF15|nr:MarR family transcriptional regulator [Frankia sp. AiPa1]MCL9762789.1 MarR family transcriptional regulator [Frankia sp. AiPa1]